MECAGIWRWPCIHPRNCSSKNLLTQRVRMPLRSDTSTMAAAPTAAIIVGGLFRAPMKLSFDSVHKLQECGGLQRELHVKEECRICGKIQGDHRKEELLHKRTFVGILVSLLSYATAFPTLARAEVEFEDHYSLYKDEEQGYILYVPEGWIKGEGKASGQRKVTAFFPTNDTNTNVNIITTTLGADFTSLGSFGPVDNFAENLVNGLDRSWKKPPGQSATLLNSFSRNGLYYVDYTLQKPGERMRHLVSVVGIGFNGWYNQLFTVTGQFWEEEIDKYKSIIEKVISSFKFQ